MTSMVWIAGRELYLREINILQANQNLILFKILYCPATKGYYTLCLEIKVYIISHT